MSTNRKVLKVLSLALLALAVALVVMGVLQLTAGSLLGGLLAFAVAVLDAATGWQGVGAANRPRKTGALPVLGVIDAALSIVVALLWFGVGVYGVVVALNGVAAALLALFAQRVKKEAER